MCLVIKQKHASRPIIKLFNNYRDTIHLGLTFMTFLVKSVPAASTGFNSKTIKFHLYVIIISRSTKALNILSNN